MLTDVAGNRRIVLYGFVATEFGKNDAAHEALTYVESRARAGMPVPQVENRIEIRPEIARMKTQATKSGVADSDNRPLDQVLDDIDHFGITMVPEPSVK